MILNSDFLEEVKQHFNEPILIGFDLCRCVGYGEDDTDCYLIVRHPNRGLFWHTMVGGYVYLGLLKGQNLCTLKNGEECDDFTRLDSLLAWNGVPPEMQFICECQKVS
jgi:hypothetical protein